MKRKGGLRKEGAVREVEMFDSARDVCQDWLDVTETKIQSEIRRSTKLKGTLNAAREKIEKLTLFDEYLEKRVSFDIEEQSNYAAIKMLDRTILMTLEFETRQIINSMKNVQSELAAVPKF